MEYCKEHGSYFKFDSTGLCPRCRITELESEKIQLMNIINDLEGYKNSDCFYDMQMTITELVAENIGLQAQAKRALDLQTKLTKAEDILRQYADEKKWNHRHNETFITRPWHCDVGPKLAQDYFKDKS